MEIVDKKTGEVYEQNATSKYNERGEELPDPRPMALPVGFTRPNTLQERMRILLRSELLKRELDAKGVETFEEADDFDCEDKDPLSNTPYEDDFEPELPGIAAREQEIRSGQVQDRPTSKRLQAAELAAKARVKQAAYQRRWRKKKAKEYDEEDESK